MSKHKLAALDDAKEIHPDLPREITAYTVVKSSYIAARGFEIKILDGIVVSCEPLQEAEDVMQIVTGKICQKLLVIAAQAAFQAI